MVVTCRLLHTGWQICGLVECRICSLLPRCSSGSSGSDLASVDPCGGKVGRPRGSGMTSLVLADGVVPHRMLGTRERGLTHQSSLGLHLHSGRYYSHVACASTIADGTRRTPARGSPASPKLVAPLDEFHGSNLVVLTPKRGLRCLLGLSSFGDWIGLAPTASWDGISP